MRLISFPIWNADGKQGEITSVTFICRKSEVIDIKVPTMKAPSTYISFSSPVLFSQDIRMPFFSKMYFNT